MGHSKSAIDFRLFHLIHWAKRLSKACAKRDSGLQALCGLYGAHDGFMYDELSGGVGQFLQHTRQVPYASARNLVRGLYFTAITAPLSRLHAVTSFWTL